MENFKDQPPPPGVHSWSNYSSNSAPLSHSLPGNPQPSGIATQYPSNYSGSAQFYPPPCVYTHTIPPQYQSSRAPQLWDNNTCSNFQQESFSQSGVVNGAQGLPLGSNNMVGEHQNNENVAASVIQESDVRLPPEVDGTAANVSKGSGVELNNAYGIDIAAQDAVLREQVCISCM